MEQYIYIIQALLEPAKCKIGKTINLERRLKEYNNMTGKSQENSYKYLFSAKVADMTAVENAITAQFVHLREHKSKEIYFFNPMLFESYVNFIKQHPLFIEEQFLQLTEQQSIVQIIKKHTPSLEERGISRIELLHKAKKIDNDEFYTRYEDIEKEVTQYPAELWHNKTVFCNCDDAVGFNDDDQVDERRTSAFALYFLNNFAKLKLKKLICTHYGGGIDLFNQGGKGYIFTKEGFDEVGSKTYFKNYSGSFDDPLSIKILKEEADIVCTNPPFSKAIAYWKTVIDSGKQFLIISNIINPISTWCIPYFMQSKTWAGYSRVDWFLNSKQQLTDAAAHWYTNLPITNRPRYKQLKFMPLTEIPQEYKQYDDEGILLVDKGYIPTDYEKPFAVSARPILNGLLEKGYKIMNEKQYDPPIKGRVGFKRVIVQKVAEDD